VRVQPDYPDPLLAFAVERSQPRDAADCYRVITSKDDRQRAFFKRCFGHRRQLFGCGSDL